MSVLRILAILLVTSVAATSSSQELEPRAFSYAPTGFHFVAIGYGFSTGDLVFDPSLPVENADAEVHVAAIGYVTTFELFGSTGKLRVALPWADGRAQGLVNGVPAERLVSGPGDAKLGLSWLFLGAPARTLSEFMAAERSPTVAGLSVTVGVPVGEYDEERVINIGTNRFSAKTEVGISHALRRWTFEGSAAVAVFADNRDWLGSSTRTQDPIYSAQAHAVRDFKPRLWLAFDATYYWGGQARVDGVDSGVELANSRLGLTLSLPVAATQSVKISVSSGVATRTGTDFDAYGLAWQWSFAPRS